MFLLFKKIWFQTFAWKNIVFILFFICFHFFSLVSSPFLAWKRVQTCAFSFSLCNEGHDDINVVFKLLTSSWNFMVNVKDVEDSLLTCTFHSFFSITRRRLSIDSSQLLWSLNRLLIIMILVLVYSNFYWTLSERVSMIWSEWFNNLNLKFQILDQEALGIYKEVFVSTNSVLFPFVLVFSLEIL